MFPAKYIWQVSLIDAVKIFQEDFSGNVRYISSRLWRLLLVKLCLHECAGFSKAFVTWQDCGLNEPSEPIELSTSTSLEKEREERSALPHHRCYVMSP